MAPTKKRKTSGGSLTGGTGDVKPQFLTASTPVQGATGEYTLIPINIPRIIIGDDMGATIMEILRVDYYLGLADLADTNATYFAFLETRQTRAQDETSTATTGREDVASPGVFAYVYEDMSLTTTGGQVNYMPLTYDCTDNNGNGILIATDRIFFVAGSINNATQIDATCKILYRMVDVGIVEYVGIVQSQQGV